MSSILKQTLVAAATTLTLAGTAFAGPITITSVTNSTNNALGVGFGVTYPSLDLPSSVSNTITVAENDTISSLAVVIAVSHTFLGDLVYTLSHGSTTITLMDRTVTGVGYDADLSKDYPLTFSDNATSPEEAVGNDRYPDTDLLYDKFGNSVLAKNCAEKDKVIGTGASCLQTVFLPQESIGDAFAGQSVYGDWTLTVLDKEMNGDAGWFVSWTLRVNDPQDFVGSAVDPDAGQNTVPEPGTLALLGLALAGMGAARRRRR